MSYSGLCVGGPWAGRFIENHSGPVLKIPLPLEPTPDFSQLPPDELIATPDVAEYFHRPQRVHHLSGETRIFDFFIHKGMTLPDCLEAVHQGYSTYVQNQGDIDEIKRLRKVIREIGELPIYPFAERLKDKHPTIYGKTWDELINDPV